MPKVYYLAPDYDIPSWGVGMLYSHVNILNKNAIDAYILHHKAPFKRSWFRAEVPIAYIDNRELKITNEDFLVVPELNIMDKEPQSIKCKKIAFVQNPFVLLASLKKALDYSEMGYEHVMVILPSIKEIVDNFFGAQAHIVPAFVASYFFTDIDKLCNNRKKRIVTFPKPAYTSSNYIDIDICSKILNRRIRCSNSRLSKYLKHGKNKDWE